MATITGTSKSETLTGTGAADSIFGLGGNDTLNGLGGNDTLDGGTGRDKMAGGKAHDTYIVDNTGDQVIELAGEGTDTVRTTLASYTPGSNLENLAFIASGDFTGTGTGDDTMRVSTLDFFLADGGNGTDTLVLDESDLHLDLTSLADNRTRSIEHVTSAVTAITH